MLTFSNPRLLAEFNDWPSGGNHVQCKFEVEQHPKKGCRVLRTTTDKTEKWCKPKATTYSYRFCIVDGSDGKTYFLRDVREYKWIDVLRHDFFQMMDETKPHQQFAAHQEKEPELYKDLYKLIDEAFSK